MLVKPLMIANPFILASEIQTMREQSKKVSKTKCLDLDISMRRMLEHSTLDIPNAQYMHWGLSLT